MANATLFDRLDAVPLAIVTERVGFALAETSIRVMPAIVTDPRISPTVMIAGMCRAHAAGLASAIIGCGHAVDSPDERAQLEEQLIEASFAYVRELLRNPPTLGRADG